MIPEANHFREGGAAMTRGLDMANLAHRRQWTFRFHDQPDPPPQFDPT